MRKCECANVAVTDLNEGQFSGVEEGNSNTVLYPKDLSE